MINYNLAGEALVHCVKVPGAKLMLVDDDEKCLERVNNVRGRLERELGIKLVVLSSSLKAEVAAKTMERPSDNLRDGVTQEFPAALFYTRCDFPRSPKLLATMGC